MLYFFDPATKAPLVTFRIPNTGTFTIGLFEGEAPGTLSQPGLGQVTVTSSFVFVDGITHSPTPFPADHFADRALVRDTSIGLNRRLLTFRIERLRSNMLYAHYFGSVEVAMVRLTPAGEIRRSIVALARNMVKANCHYLWGTAGNTPGNADGNPGGGKQATARMRDASNDTKSTDAKTALAFRMAVQDQVDGYNTCAGRSSALNLPAASDAEVTQYLDTVKDFLTKSGKTLAMINQSKTQSSLPAGRNNLYPRKYAFRGLSATTVWGEPCEGVRHFDCVGLVNYCYAYHWKSNTPFGLDILLWASVERELDSNNNWVAKNKTTPTFINGNSAVGSVVSDPHDVMDGDVVVKASLGHIAMVYLDGNKPKIVQAEDTQDGLNDSADYKPDSWGQRIRVADINLVPMKDSIAPPPK